ncbi:MAG TPA: glutamate 5-kinase [Candidatus Binatia bacterium]|nr:glutamate 5-kinase [Candidatus Binatia bacterium]
MSAQLPHKTKLVKKLRRVVVKIGSSLLSDRRRIDRHRLEALAADACALHDRGIDVVLVTSGAIASGIARMGLAQAPKTIPERQAAAAVGQIGLMAAYEEFFAARGKLVAQILLTGDDLTNRRRYLNARNTLETLLAARVVPVANENDTVAVDEIKLGENDNLSALIATLVDADLLVILSDVDGLYNADPRLHPDAALIDVVERNPTGVLAYATDSAGPVGTGGMASKITAAIKASRAGIATVIANGIQAHVLQKIVDPDTSIGTLILAQGDRLTRRKHWIAYSLKPRGTLVVDQGARDAIIKRGRSLLPSGLREVQGNFGDGDCVRCITANGVEFARGLINYSAADLDKIKGLHSNRIEAVLGYKTSDEIIHRDDLVLTEVERDSPAPDR